MRQIPVRVRKVLHTQGPFEQVPPWFAFITLLIGVVYLPLLVISSLSSGFGYIFGSLISFLPVVLGLGVGLLLNRLVPNPVLLLGWMFLWGAVVATVVSGLVNTTSSLFIGEIGAVVVSAPIIEEVMKFVAIYSVASATGSVDNPLSGLVAGIFVGAGFTLVEDITYVLNGVNDTEAASIAIGRVISLPFFHMATAALSGWLLGRRVLAGRKMGLLPLGILVPSMFAHAVWNTLASFAVTIAFLIGMLSTIALLALSWKVYSGSSHIILSGANILENAGFTEQQDMQLIDLQSFGRICEKYPLARRELLDLRRALVVASFRTYMRHSIPESSLNEILLARVVLVDKMRSY